MARTQAEQRGLRPRARIITSAVAGVDPAYMGLGPIPASLKALQRANLSIKDMDLIELNEAFAAQTLQCIRELGIDRDTTPKIPTPERGVLRPSIGLAPLRYTERASNSVNFV